MIGLLADEDFDNDVVRGALRRQADLDIVRVQDIAMSGQPDAAILAWAATENRVVLTHDVSTMTAHAIARVQAGLPMPGLFAVSQSLLIGQVIDDVILLGVCSNAGEWEGQINCFPL